MSAACCSGGGHREFDVAFFVFLSFSKACSLRALATFLPLSLSQLKDGGGALLSRSASKETPVAQHYSREHAEAVEVLAQNRLGLVELAQVPRARGAARGHDCRRRSFGVSPGAHGCCFCCLNVKEGRECASEAACVF